MTNIVYFEDTPFYTSETCAELYRLFLNNGHKAIEKYQESFYHEFKIEDHARQSAKNLYNKLINAAEIMIAIKLEDLLPYFEYKYDYSGHFYVSSTANGVDIIYADENLNQVQKIEVKCTTGFYKKYTRGKTARPINENGFYLNTQGKAWKHHLTSKANVTNSFTDLLKEFNHMDCIQGVLDMEQMKIVELFFISGNNMKWILMEKQKTNKQNLIQIQPTSFYNPPYSDRVEQIC